MTDALLFALGLWAVGYACQILGMLLEDTIRRHNMPEWARANVDDLYSMEDYLILPALWPWYAAQWVARVFRGGR